MDNRLKNYCSSCNRGFASRQSLCNHKKRCQSKGYEPSPNIVGKDDDTASILSIGTANQIVNKSVKAGMMFGEAAKSLKRKPIEDVTSPPPKRPKDDRPDIIDCADYIKRIDDGSVKSDGSDKSEESEESDESEESEESESVKSEESDESESVKSEDSDKSEESVKSGAESSEEIQK